jgi:hypothetical protein
MELLLCREVDLVYHAPCDQQLDMEISSALLQSCMLPHAPDSIPMEGFSEVWLCKAGPK